MSSIKPSSSGPASDAESRDRDISKADSGPAQALDAGLYIVSTPIGNLRDITLRALDTLKGADEVLAEDTRMARRLFDHHGIVTKLSAYHDHNGARRRPQLIRQLEQGERLALISDAGTPLISDPGWKLVNDVLAAGINLVPVPGPSALLAGLVISGLPSDRFMFCGFLSARSGARQKALKELGDIPATLIFYESAQRLAACLQDMARIFGGERQLVIARELTKRFEETRSGRLDDMARIYQEEAPPKGEIVILLGPPGKQDPSAEQIDKLLLSALSTQSVKQASAMIALQTGLSKRDLYQQALKLKADENQETDS